ncbi:hypothetical protein [Oceanobacillus bengalensis]|uniref:Uncharacterized protein n=1 Tax=Oceanobacillus bengalensis TaxID=1435466 RepID=A0A494YV52_9BACI|nr:hypothetical protein [Oceanobacillus bengalensis]RKQ14063.1 hypothetical protein D8M05_14465 [Oceanobacillus bengalensis]
MKKIEWLSAIILIVVGLTCLTVSGATMWGNESIKSYVTILMQICFWTGLPGVILGVVYLIILTKRKDK